MRDEETFINVQLTLPHCAVKGGKCRNKAYSSLMRDVKCVDGEQEESEMNECIQMRP